MATLVNRTGWCIFQHSVMPCQVIDYSLFNATVLVLLDTRRHETINAYLFTTSQETANEWRRGLCAWCNGTGKTSDGHELFVCRHCQEPSESIIT